MSANQPWRNKTLIGEDVSQIPHKYRIRPRTVRKVFLKLDNSHATDFDIVSARKSGRLTGNSQLNEQRYGSIFNQPFIQHVYSFLKIVLAT